MMMRMRRRRQVHRGIYTIFGGKATGFKSAIVVENRTAFGYVAMTLDSFLLHS